MHNSKNKRLPFLLIITINSRQDIVEEEKKKY
jgi:hypothetical protein